LLKQSLQVEFKKVSVLVVVTVDFVLEEGCLEEGHAHAEDCLFGESSLAVDFTKIVHLFGGVEVPLVDCVAIALVDEVVMDHPQLSILRDED
jgi:hypothetical protein